MKAIKMHELSPGDIFAHEIKLHGREAFLTKKVNDKSVICESRITGKEIRKEKTGNVYLLRHI